MAEEPASELESFDVEDARVEAGLRRASQRSSRSSAANSSAAALLAAPTRSVLHAPDVLGEVRRTFTPGCVILMGAIAAAFAAGTRWLPADTFVVPRVVEGIKDKRACVEECTRVFTNAGLDAPRPSTSCESTTDFTFAKDSADGEPPVPSKCKFDVVEPVWKPLAVVAIFVVAIALIVQGQPAEVWLIGGASVLCVLGIITRAQIFEGLSESGVTSLAVLFPISEAIQETGLLEKAVSVVLGSPHSLTAALPRMMLPVAMLSAFLSNTATVALMIPILGTWSRRLGVHPGKMLMPLSFASQLGGCVTMLGSSHCLIAAGAVRNKYHMGYFDVAPVGVLVAVGVFVATAALANTPLLASSAAGGGDGDAEGGDDEAASQEPKLYGVRVSINGYGGFAGQTVEDTGLLRVPGIRSVDRLDAANQQLLNAMKSGEELQVWCTPAGVIALRAQAGLTLKNAEDLMQLGVERGHRFLYEATVDAGSPFLEAALLHAPGRLRREYGACLVAGPKTRPGPEAPLVSVGSVLLFEADQRWVETLAADRWRAACSLVSKVPGSSPLRTGLKIDKLRSGFVVFGMVVLIALCAVGAVGLDYGGVVFLLILLPVRALTVEQLFASMNTKVLLTVAGALAMGTALESTGVVTVAANALNQPSAGTTGIIAAVYAVAVFLSMFINNSATVAILAPIILSLPPEFDVKLLTWTLICGAGCCFTTPLGYQTNLMVMKDGEYTFMDFVRFGVLLQLVHMAVVVLAVSTVGRVLSPYAPFR